MKLSEAILMLGMTKPQGFGKDSMHDENAPCALGGALQMVGREQTYEKVTIEWPWINRVRAEYPCKCSEKWLPVDVMIIHLNDYDKWTRAQIAEWVASIEPKAETKPMTTETSIEQVTVAR